MAGPKMNYIVDMLMAVAFLVTATSALLFFFNVFGAQGTGAREFLGIQRSDWSFWHRWIGLAFIVFIVIHFALHPGWVTAMTKNLFSRKQ